MMRINLMCRVAVFGTILLGATGFAADIVSGLAIGATTQTIPVYGCHGTL